VKNGEVLVYTINVTPPIIVHRAQAAPTRYGDKSHCICIIISFR